MPTGQVSPFLLNKPAEGGVEQTNAAKSPRRVRKNSCYRIPRKLLDRLSFLRQSSFGISAFSPKIVPRSHLQNRNKMPELVFNIGRYRNGVSDLLT